MLLASSRRERPRLLLRGHNALILALLLFALVLLA